MQLVPFQIFSYTERFGRQQLIFRIPIMDGNKWLQANLHITMDKKLCRYNYERANIYPRLSLNIIIGYL